MELHFNVDSVFQSINWIRSPLDEIQIVDSWDWQNVKNNENLHVRPFRNNDAKSIILLASHTERMIVSTNLTFRSHFKDFWNWDYTKG